MFNLDATQGRAIRMTVALAGACWLCNQIADSSLMERIWHQLSVVVLGVGAMRVWLLEAAKPRQSSS